MMEKERLHPTVSPKEPIYHSTGSRLRQNGQGDVYRRPFQNQRKHPPSPASSNASQAHMLETTDLFQGAFLLCMGGSLSDIRMTKTYRQTATFRISGMDLHRHNTDYMTGNALVNPMQLKNALNHLRDVLFNTLREKERSHHASNRHPNPPGNHRDHQNRNRHCQPNRIERHCLKEER